MRSLKEYFNKTHEALEFVKVIGKDAGKSHSLIFSDMVYYWVTKKINPTSYSLYGFAFRTRGQKAEYLSKRQMDSLQLKLNSEDHIKFADNKLFFYERCIKNRIPTPEILGVIPALKTFVPDGVPIIHTADRLGELLNTLPYGNILFKPIDGGHGVGLLIMETSGKNFRDKDGKIWELGELFEYCQEKVVDSYSNKSRGSLMQEFLQPDERLRPIMPGPAMGTVRVHTVLGQEGNVEIFYTVARIPRKGRLLDNFRHGTTGNLIVGVDAQSGLMMDGWTVDPERKRLIKQERHPDTGVRFNTFQIPRWEEVRYIASRAARAFHELKTIGWDIAVSDKGVYVIEANWHYDPDVPQVAFNRGVKSEIRQYFSKACMI